MTLVPIPPNTPQVKKEIYLKLLKLAAAGTITLEQKKRMDKLSKDPDIRKPSP